MQDYVHRGAILLKWIKICLIHNLWDHPMVKGIEKATSKASKNYVFPLHLPLDEGERRMLGHNQKTLFLCLCVFGGPEDTGSEFSKKKSFFFFLSIACNLGHHLSHWHCLVQIHMDLLAVNISCFLQFNIILVLLQYCKTMYLIKWFDGKAFRNRRQNDGLWSAIFGINWE